MKNQPETREIGGDAAGRRSSLWILYPLVLAAAVSTLYLLTLRGGIGGESDTGKWQFLGKVWGVSHTTGYPLYVSINHLFSHLPFGTLAWRINFMSAFFAVLAIVVLQRILANLLKSELIALSGAMLFAVLPMFWTFAVVAGVYSLNAFFICLTIYFLFKWADVRNKKYFYAACAVYALSFGNHVTMITMLPAFVFFALATDRRAVLKPGTLLILFAFIVVSALQYSIPFVQTAIPSTYVENPVRNFSDLLKLITATGFRKYWFAGGISGLLMIQVPLYIGRVIRQFTFAGLILAVAGICLHPRKSRTKLLFIVIYLASSLFVALNYYLFQMQYQLIPSYILLTLLIGFAAGFLHLNITGYAWRRAAIVCSSAILLAMAGFTFFSNLPVFQARQSEAGLNDRLADDIVDVLPEGGVILASNYSDSMIYAYKMLGEERGREKHWRVLNDGSWKTMCAEVVGRLLGGEQVHWGPLAVQDEYRGRHEVFFTAADKNLLDEAGFSSEPVDLPGDGGGKNIYGGKQVRIYKITAAPPR